MITRENFQMWAGAISAHKLFNQTLKIIEKWSIITLILDSGSKRKELYNEAD